MLERPVHLFTCTIAASVDFVVGGVGIMVSRLQKRDVRNTRVARDGVYVISKEFASFGVDEGKRKGETCREHMRGWHG